jgi:hypothetical protein
MPRAYSNYPTTFQLSTDEDYGSYDELSEQNINIVTECQNNAIRSPHGWNRYAPVDMNQFQLKFQQMFTDMQEKQDERLKKYDDDVLKYQCLLRKQEEQTKEEIQVYQFQLKEQTRQSKKEVLEYKRLLKEQEVQFQSHERQQEARNQDLLKDQEVKYQSRERQQAARHQDRLKEQEMIYQSIIKAQERKIEEQMELIEVLMQKLQQERGQSQQMTEKCIALEKRNKEMQEQFQQMKLMKTKKKPGIMASFLNGVNAFKHEISSARKPGLSSRR